MTRPEPNPIARALGRIPSGIFIVTATHERKPVGFVGSFVMQMGFEPPTVCVAVAKDRKQLDDLRAGGRFALSILDAQSRKLMASFLKYGDDGTAFDHMKVGRTRSGLPVILDALAWVDCVIRGEHATGDHVVLFGEVVEGAVLRDGEPCVHVRKDGLAY
jgi:flavin reductase (DIM6/NTAB) family NADH-FMN oxidoreductase RutF